MCCIHLHLKRYFKQINNYFISINFDIYIAAPPVPPRNFDNYPVVGTKLEGLLLRDLEQDEDFDPRSFENNKIQQHTPVLSENVPSPPLRKLSTLMKYESFSLCCCLLMYLHRYLIH